jgi:hypothetical protein
MRIETGATILEHFAGSTWAKPDSKRHDEPTDALIYMGERIDALAQRHCTTDPKFIPHPATWLGQGRYLDPVETQ